MSEVAKTPEVEEKLSASSERSSAGGWTRKITRKTKGECDAERAGSRRASAVLNEGARYFSVKNRRSSQRGLGEKEKKGSGSMRKGRFASRHGDVVVTAEGNRNGKNEKEERRIKKTQDEVKKRSMKMLSELPEFQNGFRGPGKKKRETKE